MGFQNLILLLLTARCAYGFYPTDYIELSRLSGKAGLDSEEMFSKDETSRHDEASSEDHIPAETRYNDDYSTDYDPRDGIHTRTFSSLFEKPELENDALYSSEKIGRNLKREEYFDEQSKKSMSSYHMPRKMTIHSTEHLIDGAPGSDYNRPRSGHVGRSRRAKLSDYDEYYPKRYSAPYSEVPEYRSKPYPPPRQIDDHGDYPFLHSRQVDEPERQPRYPTVPHTKSPYYESYNKQVSKPSTKSYLRPTVPIRVEERNPSSYNRPKPRDLSTKNSGSRVSKLNHKKYPSKKHSETQARAPFDEEDDDEDEDFSAKPKTTSFSKSKSSSKPFSEENKHYLSATGYGKPVREQFHEQGVTGPHAYKFGYNTGDPENPMARYEERTPDGLVKGSYSYVDPMGKLQVVHYESHPERGFKTTHG
ncbi:hypothetical protein CDAR_61151 [Caerostris darwini]|uniref:Uncharacterized protein n=1 Tax=Caerostris darwini TaxID=1538125 RepID=A0AAV4UT65_9ARAC|nr:hypothetical protein CDAR_61151 [Caerostris darwini]